MVNPLLSGPPPHSRTRASTDDQRLPLSISSATSLIEGRTSVWRQHTKMGFGQIWTGPDTDECRDTYVRRISPFQKLLSHACKDDSINAMNAVVERLTSQSLAGAYEDPGTLTQRFRS
jgi:hypothetical protein